MPPSAYLMGAVQMTSTADLARNLDTALRLVNEAADLGARRVGLPENFAYMGPEEGRLATAETVEGPTLGALREVARKRGIRIAPDIVARTMAFIDNMPAEGTASMQRDIASGRPSELEAIVGSVVRLGREAGVAVPKTEFIYAALLPQERAAPPASSRPWQPWQSASPAFADAAWNCGLAVSDHAGSCATRATAPSMWPLVTWQRSHSARVAPAATEGCEAGSAAGAWHSAQASGPGVVQRTLLAGAPFGKWHATVQLVGCPATRTIVPRPPGARSKRTWPEFMTVEPSSERHAIS